MQITVNGKRYNSEDIERACKPIQDVPDSSWCDDGALIKVVSGMFNETVFTVITFVVNDQDYYILRDNKTGQKWTNPCRRNDLHIFEDKTIRSFVKIS